MASVVTINRPDVVAQIEVLANRLTGGNKTEVVALALRNLDERDARSGSLFGANRGSTFYMIVGLVRPDTGRISLDCPPGEWMDRFVGRPGVEAVPLTCWAASRAYGLQHFERRDFADRLLVATAIELACELVTYDGPIIDYALGYGRQSGLRVAA